LLEGDAREAARNDGDLVAVKDVRTEVDVARNQLVADETWGAGEADGGLRDVVARIGLDLGGELLALRGGRLRADEHSVTAAFADGFDDQLVQVLENMLSGVRVGEQICSGGRALPSSST
jgi:hypothetical protein